MTTAAKPLPAHGTYARANGSPGYREPCKCDPCLIARRRHDKRWKANRALGKPAMVDATPARNHIAELRKTHTWPAISRATGIAESNLYYIANGTRTEIQRSTQNAILAVRPGPKPVPTMQVDALGSRRRLQALMVVGHSVRVAASASRITRDSAHDIALGRQTTVRADVAERIANAYTQLAFRPPASNKFTKRTRNLAAARGWHGPLAWDDIDDPNEHPETEQPVENELSRNELAAVRRAEIEHLDGFNLPTHEIATRLGIGESTVAAIVRELHSGRRRDRSRPIAA